MSVKRRRKYDIEFKINAVRLTAHPTGQFEMLQINCEFLTLSIMPIR